MFQTGKNKLPRLKEIILQGNNIKQFPVILSTNSSLQRLNLSQNQLQIIPEDIRNFTSLELLDLSANPIIEINDELYNLPKLKKLMMDEIQLESPVNIPITINMPQLEFWDIEIVQR